ncbi:copper-binding protein [Thiorhodococcus minor]|uniref:Copper-binding protein n=1 Tax=Thiorhodococcus minor TaxID=57489 RepID=A0A6M0JYD9_9GAMM|nr:copper-binding protein [Thiorhodococcus minor]NEV62189.1 hypothetical protein [Thiorhodococcus minor]
MKPSRYPTTLACAATLGLLTLLPIAQAETTPVAGAAVSSELSGKVAVVNQEKRMLTIETAEGRFEVVHVPDEVQRLDEIKIGDQLTITETTLILVELRKGADAGTMGVQQDSSITREPGDKPAGMMVDSVTVTGVVQAIDRDAGRVTIMAPEETMTFEVQDPAVLADVETDDSVSASYIRAISGKVTR